MAGNDERRGWASWRRWAVRLAISRLRFTPEGYPIRQADCFRRKTKRAPSFEGARRSAQGYYRGLVTVMDLLALVPSRETVIVRVWVDVCAEVLTVKLNVVCPAGIV